MAQARTFVKMCDFGSAMFSGDNELTPYLVSRFYRAPEIMMGLPYSHPIDMWSLGCCVFEIFTGRILFNGKSNNGMLKKMMEYKGPFPKKMIKRGAFTDRHFEDDPEMTFGLVEEDPAGGGPVRTLVRNPKPTRDFFKTLQASASEGEDRGKLKQLADLLDKMLVLDPDRRLTVRDALKHPFLRE